MDGKRIYLACPSCGAMNRVPVDKLAQGPRCGSCKTPVDPGKPQALTAATFDKVAKEGDLPVLLDFWAPWCGPCRMVAPALEALARRHQGRIVVAKVNTDEEQQLGQLFRISGIPTLVVMNGGREVDRSVGALPPPQLEALAQRHMA